MSSTGQERVSGYFSSWFEERSFGFVTETGAPPNTKRRFVHRSSIVRGTPSAGKPCTFTVLENDRGPYAVNVEVG